MLVQWGARPENMAGIDLDHEAVDYCKAHAPEIRVHGGSADSIPEPDGLFDLSIAFTLFSSVPDEDVSQGIAREMLRITRPGGLMVIYDMRRRNPANRAVHPISRDDIRRWFPRCPLRVRSMTLAPPLARGRGHGRHGSTALSRRFRCWHSCDVRAAQARRKLTLSSYCLTPIAYSGTVQVAPPGPFTATQ